MVAQMQENGVPVTFAYISDAHDNHTLARASGPGEADYKQQLADYDAAFATFFQRLASHGIDKSNTLFVVTVDEGDHFAGGVGTPQADGSLAYSHTPCSPTVATCPANQIGEITTNLKAFAPAGSPSFDLHFDDAPTIYVQGPARRGTIPRCASSSGTLGAATAFDPYVNASVPLAAAARRHGRGADAAHGQRRPEADADVHVVRQLRLLLPGVEPDRVRRRRRCRRASTRSSPGTTATSRTRSPTRGSGWSAPASRATASTRRPGPITSTSGRRSTRSLGLSRLYEDDGRVITQVLGKQGDHGETSERRRPSTQLGAAYKQMNAPFGSFGARHARRVDGGDQVDRRAEVRLDRDADREPDRQARRARGNDPRSAQRRGGGRRQDQRRPGARLDEAGAEPDRSGARAGCCFIAGEALRPRRARARATAPGSSPSTSSEP